jgi:hypothetical protein
VEVYSETALQAELPEEVFGRAYGFAFPASVAGIVVGSLIAVRSGEFTVAGLRCG